MPRAGGSRRRGRSLQRLAAPKKAPVAEPIWLTFPALAPPAYRQPRRRSPTELDPLNRLAKPRPEPCEPGLPPAATNGEGRAFQPQLAAPWPAAQSWELRLFSHLEVDKEEAAVWFRSKAKTHLSTKKREEDDPNVDVMSKLSSCGHLEAIESNYKICCTCMKKVCRKCWLKGCPASMESFSSMDEEEQMRMLQDELDVEEWEARVLIRNAAPVVERLSVKSPRKVRVVNENRKVEPKEDPESPCRDEAPKELDSEQQREEEATEDVVEDGSEGGVEDFEGFLGDGDKHSISSLDQAVRIKTPVHSDAFQRLTTPRKGPVFKQIPYLPWMKTPLPQMADLCSLENGGYDPDQLAYHVDNLESEGKLEKWQARALLRCAVPVFERLYGGGSPGRASAFSARSRSSQGYR